METIRQEIKALNYWVLAAILITFIQYAFSVMKLTVFNVTGATDSVATAGLIFLPGMVLTMSCFVLLWKILARFADGRIFVRENVRTLKTIAYLQIVRVLVLSALDAFLYVHAKANTALLDLTTAMLIIYGTFIASHIFEAACKLHEENQLVV
jgi:hypothetical protein